MRNSTFSVHKHKRLYTCSSQSHEQVLGIKGDVPHTDIVTCRDSRDTLRMQQESQAVFQKDQKLLNLEVRAITWTVVNVTLCTHDLVKHIINYPLQSCVLSHKDERQ